VEHFYVTTTGTQTPVVIGDLGGRTFTHPTTNLDLLLEYTIEDIISAHELFDAADDGYLNLTDEFGHDLKIGDFKVAVLIDGKITPEYLPEAILSGLNFRGIWDADANVPDLNIIELSENPMNDYWVVNVAGTTFLNGENDWSVGDWAVNDGTAWIKIDNVVPVTSVNSRTGAVVLDTDDISDTAKTNKFVTQAQKNNFHEEIHGLDSTAHLGIVSAVENNIVVFDENGLPKDSGIPNPVPRWNNEEAETTLSNTNWTTKCTITATFTAGTYKIEWSYQYKIDSDDDPYLNVRTRLDNTTNLILLENLTSWWTDIYKGDSGFAIRDLTAGSHTITLDFQKTSNAADAFVKFSHLFIKKLSN